MSELTDLEITRLCAEAMEEKPTLPGQSDIWAVSISYIPEKKITHTVRGNYDPLRDDAEAMALVKKFRLDVEPQKRDRVDGWSIYRQENMFAPPMADSWNQDLNRAICECVAQMQLQKGK